MIYIYSPCQCKKSHYKYELPPKKLFFIFVYIFSESHMAKLFFLLAILHFALLPGNHMYKQFNFRLLLYIINNKSDFISQKKKKNWEMNKLTGSLRVEGEERPCEMDINYGCKEDMDGIIKCRELCTVALSARHVTLLGANCFIPQPTAPHCRCFYAC